MKHGDRQIHRDVARRFSAAAGGYDGHAAIQRGAAEKLVAMVPGVELRRILDLGCGTGVLTGELSRRWPAAEITAVDVAPGMVDAMKTKLPAVHSYVADIACLMGNPVFDLVASNCALHWITPFASGIRCAAEQVRPGGIAAISLMLDGTLRELHDVRREVAPRKMPAGRMPSFDEARTALAAAGLRILEAEAGTSRETYPSARHFFTMLRAQGLTAGHLARSASPLSRAEIVRIGESYEKRFAVPGGVAASYRIGYFLAEKPE